MAMTSVPNAFCVVVMDEPLPIATCKTHTSYAQTAGFTATSKVHASPCLKACKTIRRHTVFVFVEHFVTVRIIAGQVEEVDTREDDKESAKKRDCVYSICRIEATKEYE